MALVSAGFFYSVTLIDKNLNETTKEYALTSADYANAVTDSGAILTALNLITDAFVVKTALTQRLEENAVTPPTSEQSISDFVSATTLIEGAGTKKANWSVPMPTPTIMSGNDLIITNANVLAYHALFQTGGEATISDGEVAGVLQKGVRVSRARRFE